MTFDQSTASEAVHAAAGFAEVGAGADGRVQLSLPTGALELSPEEAGRLAGTLIRYASIAALIAAGKPAPQSRRERRQAKRR